MVLIVAPVFSARPLWVKRVLPGRDDGAGILRFIPATL
jgi:hypothetical protein